MAQLQWRMTLHPSALPPASPGKEIYFPPDLVGHDSQEVLADCGAFDGDGLRDYVKRWGADFSRYIAVEPDPQNSARLRDYVENLPEPVRSKCAVKPFAVGERRGALRFEATGTAASTLTADGSIEVEVRPLLELLDRPPTYIKMDVEGAEAAAVRGAAELIRTATPVLAVCAYHRPQDLWEIPALIHSISPQHRLFLRRYAEDCWELVCYAIPEERLIGGER